MELVAAIALAVLYAALTLAWGGVPPRSGSPWWVFAPFIMTFGAGLLSMAVTAMLPKPWAEGRGYARPPRRVHLSWRSAFRIPAGLPMAVWLGYVYWALRLHFNIGWVLYLVTGVAVLVAGVLARRRCREFRLLRNGEIAIAVVDQRIILDATDQIVFHFTTPLRRTVTGRGWDLGYNVGEGSPLPVFYDPADPQTHVLACSAWFEAG